MPKTKTNPNLGVIGHAIVPVSALKHYPGNARTHDLQVIAESLSVNSLYRDLVVRRSDDPERDNVVLAGNGTLEAARDILGWEEISVGYVECDDDRALRINLVDNAANDKAGYNDEALAALLRDMDDLRGTGYDEADVENLLASLGTVGGLTDPDDVPGVSGEKPISQPGDVWILGKHRLLCGDSTDADAVLAMLDGHAPDAVWTDPPYGVSYVGGTKDALTIQNDGKDDLPSLLAGAFATVVAACKPGAPVYVAHADTARVEFEGAMRGAGLVIRQNLVWVKSSLVMGRSDYHYQHEPILLAATPEGEYVEGHEPVLYGFTPGGKGRLGRGGPRWFGGNKATTVFEFPKPARNGDHPTMKPVALIEAMLTNSVPVGGLVLDLFGGSGSTLIAAHERRMRAALVELDPVYADVICRRYQQFTGEVPVLARTGLEVDFGPRVVGVS